MTAIVDVETEWNLKIFNFIGTFIVTFVDVETEWNLKARHTRRSLFSAAS